MTAEPRLAAVFFFYCFLAVVFIPSKMASTKAIASAGSLIYRSYNLSSSYLQ